MAAGLRGRVCGRPDCGCVRDPRPQGVRRKAWMGCPCHECDGAVVFVFNGVLVEAVQSMGVVCVCA